MKRIELWIPDNLAARLDKKATEYAETRAAIIRSAIRDWLLTEQQENDAWQQENDAWPEVAGDDA